MDTQPVSRAELDLSHKILIAYDRGWQIHVLFMRSDTKGTLSFTLYQSLHPLAGKLGEARIGIWDVLAAKLTECGSGIVLSFHSP